MAPPTVEDRLAKLELAVEYMAMWLIEAQKLGFTTHSINELDKIKRGEVVAKPKYL